MAAYLVRRILWSALLLIFVSMLTFLIFYKLPAADPALIRAGRSATPELIASIRKNLGLDQPIYVQYLRYMQRLIFHFDFGQSFLTGLSVKAEIIDRLPATAALAVGGAVVWLLFGIPVGIISAVKSGTLLDRFAMGIALLAVSAPVYWLGLVALYLFSKDIGQFGIFNGSGTYPIEGNILTNPTEVIPSLILPWLVLAASFAAIYARFLRGNLIEVLHEDYIRTARAKGLRERTVIFKHGVRSAITPIVTMLGLDIGILLGGAILTESVFNIPGIGRLAFDAFQKADLPVVQGVVLFGALFIVTLNLIVDIVYAFIDPRIRYD